MSESPLRVVKASKERVRLDFGNRRWVLDANGKLVERRGPDHEGDETVVRTCS